MGERPTPEAPHPGKRRPPPGTLMPPPQRAKPARKSPRCGVGDGSPHPHPPHPQPVGSGPQQPAQRAGSRGWESARPQTPHTQARGAPPGHPHAAPAARKSARRWVVDGSPRPQPPRTHSEWVVGPGSPPRGRAVGGGRAPDPGRPRFRQETPPPGARIPPAQRAKTARKSARCGVGDGSPRPHAPAPTAIG